jgi:DNA repair protein RecO (recombination protein O)
MPHTYSTEAIILRHSSVGETDRLITLYTKDYGKLHAFARGIRKPNSKLTGYLEPLNQVNILIAQGRNLPLITQADMIKGFYIPSTTFEAIVSGCYIADCLDAFTLEGVENKLLYDLGCSELKQIQTVKNGQTQLRYFELQLLMISGYQPELEVCLYCRKLPQRHSLYFSFEAGGILCRDCKNQFDCFIISATSTKALRYLLKTETQNAQKMLMPDEVHKELAYVLTNYVQFVVDRRLQSLTFARHLEKWESTL